MRQHSIRRGAVAVFTVAIAGVLFPTSPASAGSLPHPTSTEPVMQFAATHPWAASQPTAAGRIIMDLEVFDDLVYVGYGDYNRNTGPVTVAALDPQTGQFSAEAVSDTEAIYNYRVIGADLVAPAIDRRSGADYASSDPWTDHAPVRSTHAFDMVTRDGQDWWILGSQGVDAVAWRSLDQGSTWAEELRVPPTNGSFVRFYFGAALHGSLFVQAFEDGVGPHSESLVFDGSGWQPGPDLLPFGGHGWRPSRFLDGFLYHSVGHSYDDVIYYFDGSTVTSVATGFDFSVRDTDLFVLTSEATIRRTTDLRKWETVGTAPPDPASIVASDSVIYVGDRHSQIWTMPRPTSEAPMPDDSPRSRDAAAHIDGRSNSPGRCAVGNHGGRGSWVTHPVCAPQRQGSVRVGCQWIPGTAVAKHDECSGPRTIRKPK